MGLCYTPPPPVMCNRSSISSMLNNDSYFVCSFNRKLKLSCHSEDNTIPNTTRWAKVDYIYCNFYFYLRYRFIILWETVNLLYFLYKKNQQNSDTNWEKIVFKRGILHKDLCKVNFYSGENVREKRSLIKKWHKNKNSVLEGVLVFSYIFYVVKLITGEAFTSCRKFRPACVRTRRWFVRCGWLRYRASRCGCWVSAAVLRTRYPAHLLHGESLVL